jgi:hypothetical protein
MPRLTNKQVVEMVKAGLSAEVIISKIKTSRCNFETDPSILAEMKHNGVPNEVLKAMIDSLWATATAKSGTDATGRYDRNAWSTSRPS